MALIHTLFLFFATAIAVPAPQAESSAASSTTAIATASSSSSAALATCSGNTASDRSVWCDYSIDTDWYTDGPTTGETKEFWFEVTNTTASPDGVERLVLAVNGSVPGPTLEVNWGDEVVIHVTNKLTNNGTGIHWHGIRQNHTSGQDGVPSITQCPIAPGESLTYRWKATQYGTSWYHSHYSLQAWDGVFGPIVVHGPATGNYDEELEPIMLVDWVHETPDSLFSYAQTVGPPELDTGLINGKNVYGDGGSRYEVNFESGKKYLIRLINGAIDSHFKFAIDNHTFTVIASDFVPLTPYTTDVLDITMGQRYDIIVEANQATADYWMRAVPQSGCSSNANPDNIRAIVRYGSSTSDPTTTGSDTLYNEACVDEDYSNLVPHLSQTVSSPTGQDLAVSITKNTQNVFRWMIGPNTMQVQWNDPMLQQVINGNTSYEAEECVYELPDANQWVYWVIETTLPVPHPIHLHGHDFFILAEAASASYSDSVTLNLNNPPRRDVATLPSAGYLVISFKTDNPGVWLMHCHIGWHTSEGLALQFVERSSEIAATVDQDTLDGTCSAWNSYENSSGIEEEDSGI